MCAPFPGPRPLVFTFKATRSMHAAEICKSTPSPLVCFAQKLSHKWTSDEEQALVEAHVELGSKWVAIARRLSSHHREEDVKVGDGEV